MYSSVEEEEKKLCRSKYVTKALRYADKHSDRGRAACIPLSTSPIPLHRPWYVPSSAQSIYLRTIKPSSLLDLYLGLGPSQASCYLVGVLNYRLFDNGISSGVGYQSLFLSS